MTHVESSPPSADDLLAEAREHTDALLDRWAERLLAEIGGRHGEALAYALRTPGKRVRAALVLAAYRSVGGQAPGIAGVAAAVEIVHTYSLVHDDLPCMDDDDLRRGRPTTHRQFDVPTATRVGFLLVPVAARVLAAAADELGLPAGAWPDGDGTVRGRRHRGDGGWSVARPRGRAPDARPCRSSSRYTGARPAR